MTGFDLVRRAMLKIGAVSGEEAPEAQEAEDGRQTANRMIAGWSLERLMLYFENRATFDLVASHASYTIGPGGDFNVPRPIWIPRASVLSNANPSQPAEIPIKVITDTKAWQQQYPVKNVESSLCTAIYYDHGFETAAGLGKIFPYPIVNSSQPDLVLYLPTELAGFADLTTDYDFPPGYEQALIDNLALELAEDYGEPVPPGLPRKAAKSKGTIKRANIRPTYLSCDPALVWSRGRRWNWRTGQ